MNLESRTDFSRGAYSASSMSSSNPTLVCPDDVDLLVVCHTQQRRCSSIAAGRPRTTGKTFLLEQNDIPSDCVDARTWQNELSSYAGSTLQPDTLSLSTPDWNATLKQLVNAAIKYRTELKRPLRIGIDFTCCPPFLGLGLLAIMLRSGNASFVSIFYAEGKYPEAQSQDEQNEIFTIGDWAVAAIPGLSHPWSPGYPRVYVVSVGFEGNKTLRLCDRNEPDQIEILLPDPGVLEEYVNITLRQNERLFDRFNLRREQFLRANAADAVEGWRVLSESKIACRSDADVEFLCCGTKPHALSMALHVLSSGSGVVCDIVAERSRNRPIDEAGVFWRYDIENRAVL